MIRPGARAGRPPSFSASNSSSRRSLASVAQQRSSLTRTVPGASASRPLDRHSRRRVAALHPCSPADVMFVSTERSSTRSKRHTMGCAGSARLEVQASRTGNEASRPRPCKRLAARRQHGVRERLDRRFRHARRPTAIVDFTGNLPRGARRQSVDVDPFPPVLPGFPTATPPVLS